MNKQSRVSRKTLFLSLLAMSIAVLLIPQRHTKIFNHTFVRLFGKVLNLPRLSGSNLTAVPDPGNTVPAKQYEDLKIRYYNLLADLKTEHDNYEKLAQIQTGKPRPGAGWVLASVIDRTIDANRHELVISRGQSDGIEPGQYVLAKDTLAGTVLETGDNTARIRLITDAQQSIEVYITHPGQTKYIRAQMKGNGTCTCRIPLLPRESDVKTSDIVYAAASVKFLETPRIIGHISQIKPDDKKPLVLDITVEPVIQGDKIDKVAVIVIGQ